VLAQTPSRLVLLLTADTIRRCNGSIADLRGRLNIHAAMRDLVFASESDTVLTISTASERSTEPSASRAEARPEVRSTSPRSDARR
jgi:hypothetical protein